MQRGNLNTGAEQSGDKRRELLQDLASTTQLFSWEGYKQIEEMMGRIGLTMPQAIALMVLERFGSSTKMSDLARMTMASAGTVTGIVDRLIAAGFVERQRDESDRRTVHVLLTEAGKVKLQELDALRRMQMEQLMSALSDVELEQFNQLLSKMFVSSMDAQPSGNDTQPEAPEH